MIAYVVDPVTFKTVKKLDLLSYELPVDVGASTTGSVTAVNNVKDDYSRMLLRIDGRTEYYKITEAQTSDTNTINLKISGNKMIFEGYNKMATVQTVGGNPVSVSDFITGFFPMKHSTVPGNPHPQYTYASASSNYAPHTIIGSFNGVKGSDAYLPFRSLINSIGITVEDLGAEYVTTHSTQGYETITYIASGEEVLSKLALYGVRSTLSLAPINRTVIVGDSAKQAIVVDFTEGTQEPQNILFDDGHSILLSESYDNDIVSLVLVYAKNGTAKNVYLKEDGTAGAGYQYQIKGKASVLQVDSIASDDDAIAQAMTVFDQNKYNHKIEFKSDKELHRGQKVRLVLSRGVLDTVVNKVVLKSGDDRYFYTCGDLPVTATENIHASSWKYGQRLPLNPYKGQMFVRM